MQQHTGLTSFPWCPHHIVCCPASWLNPNFLSFFLPSQSFTIYCLGSSQEVLVQLCHVVMLGDKDNYFCTFPPLPAANHLPWDIITVIPAVLDMTSIGSQHTSHRFKATVWVKCPILLPGGWQQKLPVGPSWSILASDRSVVLVTMPRAFVCGAADDRQKKKILPCPFGLQSYEYILKVQQQLRLGPNFIMFKVIKKFKRNRDISNFCLEMEV